MEGLEETIARKISRRKTVDLNYYSTLELVGDVVDYFENCNDDHQTFKESKEKILEHIRLHYISDEKVAKKTLNTIITDYGIKDWEWSDLENAEQKEEKL